MNEEQINRLRIKEKLQSQLESTIEQRIDRYLEIDHQGIIGNHYFSAASSECITLYHDGHFISVVMVSQAVNEGIIRFIAERNNIESSKQKSQHRLLKFFAKMFKIICQKDNDTKSIAGLIDELKGRNIISISCADASKRIWGSFRNDVHHMNPNVTMISFDALAKRNLQDIAIIEKEIFGADFREGALIPHQSKYWDLDKNGTVPVYLRLE